MIDLTMHAETMETFDRAVAGNEPDSVLTLRNDDGEFKVAEWRLLDLTVSIYSPTIPETTNA